MFTRDPRDLTATLAQMDSQARAKANCNQLEAKKIMADWIKQDRRLDGLDPHRLAARVMECRSNGAHLDLEDPFLQRNGQRRPLDYRS